MSFVSSRIRLLLLLMFVQVCHVYAAQQTDLQFHGFVSQTAIRTDGNQYADDTDKTVSLGFREAGIGAIWRAHESTTLSGQILVRQFGDSDSGSVRIDHLTLDRNIADGYNYRVGVRVGQVKHPYGLFNTTRDVAHTRPGVLLPQSIYHDRVRDLVLSAPGVSLYGDHAGIGRDIDWQVNLFIPDERSDRLEILMLGGKVDGRYTGTPSMMSNLFQDVYLTDSTLRTGVSIYDINIKYKSQSATILSGTSRLSGLVLSLEYAASNWSVAAEGAIGKIRNKDYGDIVPEINLNKWMDAGYVQLNYSPFADITMYTRVGALYLDRTDRSGKRFAASTGVYPFTRYAQDFTLGIRKDYGNIAVWLEATKVRGTAWVPDRDIHTIDQVRDWNMLLMQVAYRW